MTTGARLGAFGAVLVAAFAAAWGVGTALDPIAPPADDPAAAHDDAGAAEGGHADGGHDDADGDDAGDDAGAPPLSVTGLSVAADGYRLVTETTDLAVGELVPFRFRIVDDTVDPTGAPDEAVTDFDETHERELHLIVVRQDLTGFQHVHPTMGADGTWTIDLGVADPGAYRVYAEFQPAGASSSTVLSTVAFAPGTSAASAIGGDARVATVDGFELTLTGDLIAGTTSEITVSVRRSGDPVTDLQPYLGAAGHLVALRSGDLAYAHVHPIGGFEPGPDLEFGVEVPTPGTYRLFLDFQHGGVVRTAVFTVVVDPPAGGPDEAGS
jgi:hypothetical protein